MADNPRAYNSVWQLREDEGLPPGFRRDRRAGGRRPSKRRCADPLSDGQQTWEGIRRNQAIVATADHEGVICTRHGRSTFVRAVRFISGLTDCSI